MYAAGDGVPRNVVVAYALVSLAVSAEDAHLRKIDTLSQKHLADAMSPQQIASAQNLSLDMAKPGNLLPALDHYLAKLTSTAASKPK